MPSLQGPGSPSGPFPHGGPVTLSPAASLQHRLSEALVGQSPIPGSSSAVSCFPGMLGPFMVGTIACLPLCPRSWHRGDSINTKFYSINRCSSGHMWVEYFRVLVRTLPPTSLCSHPHPISPSPQLIAPFLPPLPPHARCSPNPPYKTLLGKRRLSLG